MSEVQQVIANVLREHQQSDEWGYPIEECRCNATFAGGYADHVAEAIDAALGGLTRESFPMPDRNLISSAWEEEHRNLRRWVGRWTPQEAGK